MAETSLSVVIIGGGIGGLCLAQGLKNSGIQVAVYERERTSSERLQGYRIHIDEHGNRALAACLSPALFKRYLETSGSGGSGYRISTHQLRQLAFFPAPSSSATDPIPGSLSVSRITLREILLTGLEDVVHFDKTFTHYEQTPDTVTAYFEDGTSATGSMLIGADGGNSRVRRQFLPHAQRLDTGVTSIMGKLALNQATRQLRLPGQLDGATSILGPNGRAMFVAIHELSTHGMAPTVQPAAMSIVQLNEASGRMIDTNSDYIFWAILMRQHTATHNEDTANGATLQATVLDMIRDWHPHVRQLVRVSDPSTIIVKPLMTSRPIKPWTTTRVTLLGDAIHSMPPTRGSGGNTALRDAQMLCEQLITVQTGQQPLLPAIHRYERAMARYGFAMVRRSMQTLNVHVAESRRMFMVVMKVIKIIDMLKTRLCT